MPDLLTADAVGVRHGRRVAVDDVSVRLRHGEVLAVIGPNGSGKTSLARVLAGLARPSAGRVLLDGADLADLPAAARARRIAYVGQDEHGDIPFTAREVVLLGRSVRRRDWQGYASEDHDRVGALLVDLELKTLASRRMDAMSGGERQRVLIARALAQDASLIVLDEPTNHLDVRFCHHLLDRLRRTAGDGTTGVVVVLHDLDLAATYADRIAVLHAGRLVADGPPERALEPAAISRVYRTAARMLPDGEGHRLVFGPRRGGRRDAACHVR